MLDPIKQYENYNMDEKTQKELNVALKDDTGFNEGHEDFLKMLIEKLNTAVLDPYNPETLYNRAIYDKLTEEQQEKSSLTAVNLMSTIRQIQALWKIDQSASFQIQNLVETVFQMKSKFEKEYGDVYII